MTIFEDGIVNPPPLPKSNEPLENISNTLEGNTLDSQVGTPKQITPTPSSWNVDISRSDPQIHAPSTSKADAEKGKTVTRFQEREDTNSSNQTGALNGSGSTDQQDQPNTDDLEIPNEPTSESDSVHTKTRSTTNSESHLSTNISRPFT